jgi:hypothetical protein
VCLRAAIVLVEPNEKHWHGAQMIITTHFYQAVSLWKFDTANGPSCKLLTGRILGAGSSGRIRTYNPPVNSSDTDQQSKSTNSDEDPTIV